MFWKKRTEYLSWDRYSDIIETWDAIAFSQRARQEYIERMPRAGA